MAPVNDDRGDDGQQKDKPRDDLIGGVAVPAEPPPHTGAFNEPAETSEVQPREPEQSRVSESVIRIEYEQTVKRLREYKIDP